MELWAGNIRFHSNILEFLKALPACAKDKGITFSTPTEVITKLKSVSQLDVPYPMSWVDEERKYQLPNQQLVSLSSSTQDIGYGTSS